LAVGDWQLAIGSLAIGNWPAGSEVKAGIGDADLEKAIWPQMNTDQGR
jgi:hypothetical protein